MEPAKVKISYKDGAGFAAAQRYAEKLFAAGFKYSYAHPDGSKVYYHYDLGIDVLVYVA